MTPKSFAVVACRLLAIWFFVQSLRDFADTVSQVWHARNWSPPPIVGYPPFLSHILNYGLAPLVSLCAAVILWLGAFVLAENMTRGTQEAEHDDKIGIGHWQAVGFSLVGTFLCAQGLSFLGGYVVSYLFAPMSLYGRYDTAETWTNLTIGATQFVIGFALLFWSQKTIRVLDYLARGGRDETDSE